MQPEKKLKKKKIKKYSSKTIKFDNNKIDILGLNEIDDDLRPYSKTPRNRSSTKKLKPKRTQKLKSLHLSPQQIRKIFSDDPMVLKEIEENEKKKDNARSSPSLNRKKLEEENQRKSSGIIKSPKSSPSTEKIRIVEKNEIKSSTSNEEPEKESSKWEKISKIMSDKSSGWSDKISCMIEIQKFFKNFSESEMNLFEHEYEKHLEPSFLLQFSDGKSIVHSRACETATTMVSLTGKSKKSFYLDGLMKTAFECIESSTKSIQESGENLIKKLSSCCEINEFLPPLSMGLKKNNPRIISLVTHSLGESLKSQNSKKIVDKDESLETLVLIESCLKISLEYNGEKKFIF